MASRRIVVLVNPSAGGVDGGEPDPQAPDGPLGQAVEALRDEGEVTITVIEGPTDITDAADGLGEGDVLAVAGGDGTLHRVVNALAGWSGHLLLIPAGTGNDFCGGIGLPADLVEAAALAGSGSPRQLDVLEVGDLMAVNAAHLGIGVQAAEAASDLKGALGKLAYPAGAVAAATRFEPTVVTLEVDGEVVVDAEPVAMVALCNGRTVGGGTALCPLADPGDGLVDVVVLRAITAAALAATATALLRGTHLDRDDVLHLQGAGVTVRVHDVDGPVAWNVDGELLDRPAELTCRVRVGAWALLLP